MASNPSALATKLSDLADRARRLQLESGTTAPSLAHLEEGRTTTRSTLSLLLVHGRRKPIFVFHREPMPQKDVTLPPTHRAAVFGGGIQAEEEKRLEELSRSDPLLVDPRLLGEKGEYPPDAWYRLQGRHMLEHGALQRMRHPWTPETVHAFIRTELRKRLRMEAGAAARDIEVPELLTADPVETAVLHRRLGDFTEAIAERHGMGVNARGELEGIGILVQERFALSELLARPDEFVARSQGAALAWDADRLVANAERDTRDIGAWTSRLARQENDAELPVRNHSLLVGASAAAAHLTQRGAWGGLWRGARRLFRGRRTLGVAA